MRVILLSDIKKLGKKGQVVQVKAGYARNYLLPSRLAQTATDENLKLIQLREEKEKHRLQKEKGQAQELAEKLSKLSLTIASVAKEDEELFGSVNAQAISQGLSSEGFEIDKEKILLEAPIKKLGIYEIKVELMPEVETSFKLWVVKK